MKIPIPSFDSWTIIFLIAAVQGLFVALVLLRWKRGYPLANQLLAALLILFGITLIEYVSYWTNYIFQYIHMANLSAQFPFLFGPLVWLYLRTIYEQTPLQKRDSLQVLPFLVAVLLFWPWYGLDADSKIRVTLNQAPFPLNPVVGRVLLWGRVLHMAAYAVWNTRYILRQPVVGGTTRWAVWFNAFYIGFLLAYTSYFVFVRFPFFNVSWDYHISAMMTAFIYLIAYAGYAQPAVFDGYSLTESAVPVKYRNSGLTADAGRSLLHRLDTLMREERLYRDPELSLEVLANRLDASKHHVSQIINEHLNASFFEFVNQLRIEEAKKLLTETSRSDLHVIEAAYAVGFNNKVSFNTAFKKATGMTPTAYRRSHSRSDGTADQPGAVGE